MIRLAGFWLLAAFIIAPSIGRGSEGYTYAGTPFTFYGGETHFSPGDRVTGFVQFSSAPPLGGFLVLDDIEACELAAGDLVVTEMQNEEAWFMFDDQGQMTMWSLDGYRQIDLGDRYMSVVTYRDDSGGEGWGGGDYAYVAWNTGGEEWPFSVAYTDGPGEWTLQNAPAPATAVLWSVMGLAALAWSCRARRNRLPPRTR